MPVFLANPLVQSALGWLAKWVWKKLEDWRKDQIAEEQIKKNVHAVLEKYELLVLRFDELSDQGKLTDEVKNEIRNEKIKLEESLINRIQP